MPAHDRSRALDRFRRLGGGLVHRHAETFQREHSPSADEGSADYDRTGSYAHRTTSEGQAHTARAGGQRRCRASDRPAHPGGGSSSRYRRPTAARIRVLAGPRHVVVPDDRVVSAAAVIVSAMSCPRGGGRHIGLGLGTPRPEGVTAGGGSGPDVSAERRQRWHCRIRRAGAGECHAVPA